MKSNRGFGSDLEILYANIQAYRSAKYDPKTTLRPASKSELEKVGNADARAKQMLGRSDSGSGRKLGNTVI